jgi:hypothetical protein
MDVVAWALDFAATRPTREVIIRQMSESPRATCYNRSLVGGRMAYVIGSWTPSCECTGTERASPTAVNEVRGMGVGAGPARLTR